MTEHVQERWLCTRTHPDSRGGESHSHPPRRHPHRHQQSITWMCHTRTYGIRHPICGCMTRRAVVVVVARSLSHPLWSHDGLSLIKFYDVGSGGRWRLQTAVFFYFRAQVTRHGSVSASNSQLRRHFAFQIHTPPARSARTFNP